ncbi:unnamed protein product [Auanema sp. JU1783]|nr:unnamed protein product [Auanema sp. JU1783]
MAINSSVSHSRGSPLIDPVGENEVLPIISTSSHSSLADNTMECVVCGDKSSGKHYGQFSCEGCKSFFKRSIRRSLSYTCRGQKNCPVDVHHRNQCQFCRLRKCVKMGMRKEAVQRGRVPPVNLALPFNSFFQNPPMIRSVAPYNHFFSNMIPSLPQTVNDLTNKSESFLLDSIAEFGAQLLFAIIDWTKQLPFYADLASPDQITLLQNSWSQLFLLYVSQSSIPHQIIGILATAQEDSSTYTRELKESAISLQGQLDLIKSLQLDIAEMNCVKAAVLFNPDTHSLHGQSKVELVQEKIQASLDDYCRMHKSHQPGRFGRILLRLPALKLVNTSAVERIFFNKLSGSISITALLKALLLQQTLPGSLPMNNQIANSQTNTLISFIPHWPFPLVPTTNPMFYTSQAPSCS